MAIKYPELRKDNVKDEYIGQSVIDPFRYLEDPQDAETKKFVEKNNKIVDDYLKDNDFEYFRERLKEVMKYTRMTVPKKRGQNYFYLKNEDNSPQPLIMVRNGFEGEDDVLLDINQLSDDGTSSSMLQSYSHDGKYMAFYLSEHGSDWQKIIVFDIEKRKMMEEIEWVTMNSIAWDSESNGFYYSRFPDQTGLSVEEQRRDSKLYYHKVGTPLSEDDLVLQPDSPEEGCSPLALKDGEFIFVSISESTLPENKLYFKKEDEPEFTKIIDEFNGYSYDPIEVLNNTLYLKTSENADNNRIVKIDLNKLEKEHWQDTIKETDHVIRGAWIVDFKLLLRYEVDVSDQLKIYDLDGNHLDDIELPTRGTLSTGPSYDYSSISCNYDDNEIYFGFTSFYIPMTVYRYDLENQQYSTFQDPNMDLDTSNLVLEQKFCSSSDGTEIPMYILYKEGMERNSKNPTLLYGYGGFNISLLPTFKPDPYVWVQEGGIFVSANLRGGGEYGKKWHEAAITGLGDKQVVFDDFIAVAEYLIRENYTSSDYLAINGRSNGGLLTGATMVQRPDLFAAAVPQVGVLDMLRYNKQKDAGRYWVKEYGDPNNPEHFKKLYEFSPYHEVLRSDNVEYPPTLITAAESDDRVSPAHSKKFGAALQAKQVGDNPILIYIETKTGHGYGKSTDQIIEDTARMYAFLKKQIM